MRLIAEYMIKATGRSIHTTQEFNSIEDAVDYITSRPKNKNAGIEKFYGEKTRFGDAEVTLVVEEEKTVKYYHILS